MNTWSLTDDALEIDLVGLDQLWSLRGRITVPRASIRAVSRHDGNLAPPAWRLPGTYLPGVIAAGTYYGDGRKEFWMSRAARQAVVIDLDEGAPYTRVVVDLDDADGLLAALAGAGPAGG